MRLMVVSFFCGGTFGSIITLFVTGRRDKRKRVLEARITLKAIFTKFRYDCANTRMLYRNARASEGEREHAIAAFGEILPECHRVGFKVTCDEYRKCCNPEASRSGCPEDFQPVEKTALIKAIDDMLDYANKT